MAWGQLSCIKGRGPDRALKGPKNPGKMKMPQDDSASHTEVALISAGADQRVMGEPGPEERQEGGRAETGTLEKTERLVWWERREWSDKAPQGGHSGQKTT